MAFGTFLDSLPAGLFVAAHVLFLAVAVWAATRKTGAMAGSAGLFWLYAASQVIFLTFFGGALTMKMAVLGEQTLIVVMVVALALRK